MRIVLNDFEVNLLSDFVVVISASTRARVAFVFKCNKCCLLMLNVYILLCLFMFVVMVSVFLLFFVYVFKMCLFFCVLMAFAMYCDFLFMILKYSRR